MAAFQKATKKRSKLRAAIFGPSGSGKTFTALRIATGMGGRLAVIDTEFGSASKYSDRFSFDVLELKEDQTIDAYVAGILEAANAGYDVLLIDSMTHGWQELLAEIDLLAKNKYRGNTWSAWSEGTPKQKVLIKAILSYPGHIIATMRSKTEWESTKDNNGKVKPVRIGLAPDEGKGIEYEFDLLVELSTEHVATIIKDRTGKYQDKIIDKPGEEFGAALVAWLSEGEVVASIPPPTTVSAKEDTSPPAQAPLPQPAPPPAPESSPAPDKVLVLPFGKFKGLRPDELDYDQLRHEMDFWQTRLNESDPKWKDYNEKLLRAVADALAKKMEAGKPSPEARPPLPGEPSERDRLYIEAQEMAAAKGWTEAKLTVHCRKAYQRGMNELNVEQLKTLKMAIASA